jgi:hypothetical protein
MTVSQYQVLLSAVRGLSERVDYVADRLAYTFPTRAELDAQLDAELDQILREADCGVQPFAAELEIGVHAARLARRLAESDDA